jgi:hypothetical protein
MHRRALGVAVRAGSFGALAAVVTATSLVPPASAAPSRPAPAHMYTLTVKGVNLAGHPDTGDGVLLLDVDNTKLLDPVESQQ